MQIQDTPLRKNLVSLTSLIDVVFILLVFFMLVSSFSKWKSIELAVGTVETITNDLPAQSLVEVNFNSDYLLDGKQMALPEIIQKLEHLISLRQDHIVMIKPTKDLPLQQLITALEAIEKVAGKNLSLVMEES